MAFSAVAALAAASAETVTATMVLGAVAEVGTAMTVVGAVTGNKTLTKVGGVMSLVGGVGGMVAGAIGGAGGAAGAAGAMGEGAADTLDSSLVGGAADDVQAAAAASDAGGGAAAAAAGPDASALDQSLGADSSGSMVLSSDSQPINPTDARLASGTQTAPGVINSAITPPAQAAQGAAGTAPAVSGVADVSTPAGTVGSAPAPVAAAPVAPLPGAITNPTDARLAAGTQTTPGGLTSPLDSASFFQKMLTYAQDPRNKTVLQMGEKLVGGALQGVQVQKQFDAKLALDQQRVNQTSHGSQVSRTGIISGARR